MSSKRKRQENEASESVHASRQSQVFRTPNPSKKPRRSEPPVYKKQVHTSSVNAIKKRIRDVTRRLERKEDLPANVRVDDERALDAFQQELAAAEVEKTRQKHIKKYHMVRFFERQKATRVLKRLRKELLEANSTEEVQALNLQMHAAEVDLNYTQYSPLAEIYISLYPPKKEDDSSETMEEGTDSKPPVWAEVEKCMEEGTLNRLRNRTPTLPLKAPRKLEIKPAKRKPQPDPDATLGMNRRQRRSQGGVKERSRTKNNSAGFERNQAFGALEVAKNSSGGGFDEGSDGGFFEE